MHPTYYVENNASFKDFSSLQEPSRVFIMAKYLRIFNFTSEEPPYQFDYNDATSTILDVKKFINKYDHLGRETLSEISEIKIYWMFVALQDDVLVKDLLDQDAELYALLPEFGPITATGITTKYNFSARV